MRLVDAFRFHGTAADEAGLLDLPLGKFESAVRELPGEGVSHALVALFDARLCRPEMAPLLAGNGALSFTVMPPLDDDAGPKIVQGAADIGVKGVVFHPYLQDIGPGKIPVMVELARRASDAGLMIGVCTAYGGRRIFDIDPLKAALAVAEAVTTPVLFNHAGGARVLDALLIADAFPHIYLETSFSLSYWIGSSIENDMAFAMRKLGRGRWVFGSDAPFIDQRRAIADHLAFFDRHGFTATERDEVMGGTMAQLLGLGQ